LKSKRYAMGLLASDLKEIVGPRRRATGTTVPVFMGRLLKNPDGWSVIPANPQSATREADWAEGRLIKPAASLLEGQT
jgi:hypothetical protein